VALAALIHAASKCAAAPGHTAQPFQPTRTAKKFLVDAWKKDIAKRTHKSLLALSGKYAKRVGRAAVGDANKVAKRLKEGDLAFIDPPYSGVHYSRFYHVLETIARGNCGDVSGVGRYPDPSRRPRSQYSVGSESEEAFEELLRTISSRGARAVVTFPSNECSNGLSGDFVLRTARKYFSVKKKTVASNFSTLGGTAKPSKAGKERAARRSTQELILVLGPKES
jgi:adenine-specific DNA methylase